MDDINVIDLYPVLAITLCVVLFGYGSDYFISVDQVEF